jgi:predicted site-specific integrase-resolvase
MKYLSTSQAAEKWKISARRVAILCEEGRIDGVQKAGSTWIIPDEAIKPVDNRIKSGKYIKVISEEKDSL